MKEKRHGLSDVDGATLLDLLRDCANSPPNRDLQGKPADFHYQQALALLKSSSLWKDNTNIQRWLSSNWLCSPEVSPRAREEGWELGRQDVWYLWRYSVSSVSKPLQASVF